MTTQNQWDSLKAMQRRKFIAIQAYLKKRDKLQRNNLTLHLKQRDKEQDNPKESRRKEIIKSEQK